jgi:hypothetical protein
MSGIGIAGPDRREHTLRRRTSREILGASVDECARPPEIVGAAMRPPRQRSGH